MHEVGDIVGGFGDHEGVTLHVVTSATDDAIEISIDFYPPDHPDFNWAVERLNELELE